MKAIWRLIWPLLLNELCMLVIRLLLLALNITEVPALRYTFMINLMQIAVFAWLYHRDRKKRQEKAVPVRWFGALFLLIFGSAFLAVVGNILMSMTALVEMSENFQEVNASINSSSTLAQLAVAGIAAPIAEELVTRGVFYGRLREVFTPKAAILFSALFFGVLHGNIVQGIYGFVMGLYLGWIMERYQNIKAPIVAHMSMNCVVILLGALVA